ncbi:hypothetical protein ACFQ34_23060 [Pseudonocardia benzenivorans]|uniref:Uncharacterized protein n=1 Tax=Pseudonocardia benzenivorans TaxID=228005 RepID=A0ABW3VNC9_9PSEU
MKLLLAIAGPSPSTHTSTAQAGHCEDQAPDNTPQRVRRPHGNSVIAVGNYVIATPTRAGNFMIADTTRPSGPSASCAASPSSARLSFDATLWNNRIQVGYELQVSGLQGSPVTGSRAQLLESKPHGLAVRMENRVAGLDKSRADAENAVQSAHEEISRAEAQLDAPCPHAAALEEARHVARDLDRQMTEWAAEQEPSPAEPAAGERPTVAEAPGSGLLHPAARAAATLAPPPVSEPRHTAGPAPTNAYAGPVPSPQTANSLRHSGTDLSSRR